LVEAGIERGMNVLDIGCGTGEVSFTAGELVGPTGEVLGVDRGKAAVDAAREKAHRLGLSSVRFEQAEVDELEAAGSFDALVGRFVLMHQDEPGRVLARAAASVRPGGIVVMIESYMDLIRHGHSEPPSPLYEEIVHFKCEVVERAGADIRAGARLRRTFRDAGLSEPTCRLETRLEGGPESLYYEYVAESVRSMLPEAARTGVQGFSPSDVDDLAERLRSEVVASGGVLLLWPAVYAFARLPEDGSPTP
jgi:ubiquinone/menaquinone biosynthesis C-methylase UbiE